MRPVLPRPRRPGAVPRHRDERGVALPSPVVALSILAVALAGAAFVVTDDGDRDDVVAVSRPADTEESPSGSPTPAQRTAKAAPVQKQQKKKPVQRGETYVVVFNNTNISGLAGSVAAQAQGAGWQVVGSDDWVGTIPQTTVYYPPRLKEAGRILARDLGVERRMPAVEPMQFDRLTVILTGPL